MIELTILKLNNVILREEDPSKIKELEAMGYEKVDEKGNVIGEKKEEVVKKSTHEKVLKENADLRAKIEELELAQKASDEAEKK